MSQVSERPDQRIVLLNGPAGVGKTTLGRRLAATVCNGVCIHGDDLKHFVVAREPGAVQQGLSYVGGAALADVFLDAGYDLVVFEFIFTRSVHVERFRRALRSDAPVHLLTLWAPLATIADREAARPNRERLGDRAVECWNELATRLGELGTVIDARGTEEQVLALATRIVEGGTAQLGNDGLAASALKFRNHAQTGDEGRAIPSARSP
jgi:chloramphenicol 3-O-phosphotransferase